jgi:hypothetical protein
MEIAGHFELTVRLAGISRLFPVARLRPARSLREQGTQSWQLDAVTIDQGLRHGGHGVPPRIFRFLPQNIGDTGAKRNVGA